MNTRFTNLITEVLQEYDKVTHKHKNYTDTYSKDYLEEFITVFRDWTMMQHCMEDREAMDQRDQGNKKLLRTPNGRVVAEIKTTSNGKTTIRKIHSTKLEQQIEVDERRTAYEEGLDKHDIH